MIIEREMMNMPPKARLGDQVDMRCPHGGIGTIISGSEKEADDVHRTARIGDKVQCNKCGQIGIIVKGSPNIFVDGRNAARLGDTEVGTCNPGYKCCPHSRCGIIIEGSSTVFSNDGDGK
jgi:uncharacterized Zn-binding protein involved in type VI secretion